KEVPLAERLPALAFRERVIRAFWARQENGGRGVAPGIGAGDVGHVVRRLAEIRGVRLDGELPVIQGQADVRARLRRALRAATRAAEHIRDRDGGRAARHVAAPSKRSHASNASSAAACSLAGALA